MKTKIAIVCSPILALAAISAFSQDDVVKSTADLVARYPTGSIDSIEKSEQALRDAMQQRVAVDTQFVLEKDQCLEKFFVNACIDSAKERHRAALKQARSVQNEANTFQRKQRVIERDKALMERAAQEEQEKPIRLKQEQENVAIAAQKAEKAAEQKPVVTTTVPDHRSAEHDAKLKRLRAEEAANEKKRAGNVADYEAKVKEAKEHQREVETRKQEREKDRASKSSLMSAPSPTSSPQQ